MAWTTPRTWVTGETVTAALMNAHIRDNLNAGFPDAVSSVSWTPTMEGTTTDGDPANNGAYWRGGPLLKVFAQWTFAVSGLPTGTFFVTLPTSSSGLSTGSTGQVVGTFQVHDASAATAGRPGVVYLHTASTVRFLLDNDTGNRVSDANPFTWVPGDSISFFAEFPVA